MLARYRKGGKKKFSVANEHVIIDSMNWTPIHDVRVFMKIQEHPDVFDVVKFFDYRPLIPHAKHLKIDKDLIITKERLVVDKLKKMHFLRYQAYKDNGEHIFKVLNYNNRDFRAWRVTGEVLNAFIYRSKGGLGDIIMTTPVIEEVKNRYPKSQITYACPKEFMQIMESNPFIDNLVHFKARETQTPYDIVINLTTDCIQYELKKGMGCGLNRPEIFIRSCGMSFEYTPSPKVYLTKSEIELAKHEVDGLPIGPKIGIVLTSYAPVRQWHKFEELREKLIDEYPNATVLEIAKGKPKGWNGGKYKGKVYPVFGRSLRELAALMNECDVVISPDTGPAHISSSLRVPTIWLFTHIDGKVRTKNYRDVHVIQSIPSECHSKGRPCWYEIPCSKVDGVSRLELRENPLCSQAITVEMVMEKVGEVLSAPNLSYIVVYHGQYDITKKCISLLLKQRRWNDEIVVVNNGTARLEEFYPGVNEIHNLKTLNNEENLGCILARNQGLKNSSGRYVMFVDSDQYVAPQTTHRLFTTEGDLVGVEGWSVDNAGLASNVEDGKGRLAYVGAGCLLVKRSILEELDGFDEAYAPAWFEDPDLCFRARKKGYKIAYQANSGVEHLQHRTVNNQKTFNWKDVWHNSHQVFMKKWKSVLDIRFIRMLVDVPGWAWDNKAKQIIQYLKEDFEIEIEYLSDERMGVIWGDEVFFTFECNTHMFSRVVRGRPYITGVTAHTYKNMKGHRELMEGAIAIHANSKLLYDEVKRYNANCFYVPNGVDEGLFRYNHRDIDEEFTVGYVGKPMERKGLSKYIIPACKKAGVNFVMQACKYKDTSKVEHHLMPKFYDGVDCIIIASDMDGTPNQLLEAAAVGRTFIGNKIGNVPEFVDEGVNGFMLDGRRIDDYVDRLLWLKENRQRCRDMGVAARRTVETGWTWKIQSEKYREMFERCM